MYLYLPSVQSESQYSSTALNSHMQIDIVILKSSVLTAVGTVNHIIQIDME